MTFRSPHIVTQKLKTPSSDEIKAAELELNCAFPDGYADFVSTLGEGAYSNFVRMYMPNRITSELDEFRKRWQEYWFWGYSDSFIQESEVSQLIIIGDTMNGDEFVFHSNAPNRIIVLPRYHEEALDAGNSVSEMIEWALVSGKLTAPIKFEYFESWIDRSIFAFKGEGEFSSVTGKINAAGLHSCAHTSFENGELFHEFFIPSIAGSISIIGFDKIIEAYVSHDSKIDKSSINIFEQLLSDCRLKKV